MTDDIDILRQLRNVFSDPPLTPQDERLMLDLGEATDLGAAVAAIGEAIRQDDLHYATLMLEIGILAKADQSAEEELHLAIRLDASRQHKEEILDEVLRQVRQQTQHQPRKAA